MFDLVTLTDSAVNKMTLYHRRLSLQGIYHPSHSHKWSLITNVCYSYKISAI